MQKIPFYLFILTIWDKTAGQSIIYQNDMNFRVDPGARTCFFETGKAGQIMEVNYQVVDGQQGELDISFEIIDPNGNKLLDDYKNSENSVIMDLEVDGDYVFCLDNSFSMMNSKLVYVYVLIEDKISDENKDDENEAVVAVVDEEGREGREGHEPAAEKGVLEWMGTYENGTEYFIEVAQIAASVDRTLRHVVRARHLLDMHGVARSRDSYRAFKDTFIVDVWSAFQITFMAVVGLVQVYSIKKLFNRSDRVTTFY